MHRADEVPPAPPEDAPADPDSRTFTWSHEGPGRQWTFLRAPYRATVTRGHNASWAAEVTRGGMLLLAEDLRTFQEARAWCETRVQELIADA
jgi:hypothetical protein